MENATNMTAVMVFIGNRDCGHFFCVAFSCMIRVDVERRAAMKSRLSANKYIRNNKRICFVLILALALSFAAMYVVAFLLNATTESIKPIAFELPKKMSFASINNPSYNVDRADFADVKEYAAALRKAKEQFFADLNADPDVEKVYDTQVLKAPYFGVVGGIGYEFPLLEAEELPIVMKHFGAELIEGRMPSGDGELLIDEKVMKNGRMKVGDWFREDSYGEVFHVVGIIRSKEMICMGTPRGSFNNGWGYVVLCNEKSADFRKLAAKYGVTVSEENGDSVSDIRDYREMYENGFKKVIDSVITGILMVVMVFLSISVVVAYVSFLRNRVNEYCLYASIGYSKGEIYGMLMREMGIMFLAGIVLGVVFSIALMGAMNAILIVPKGLAVKWFMKDQVLRILGAFAVIVGALQIPAMISINSIKTIDLMED